MDIERCPRSAHRIVVVGSRGAEERHDGVADMLIDRAAITDDDAVHQRREARHKLMNLFRVQRTRKGREPGEIGEEYSDLAPLARRRGDQLRVMATRGRALALRSRPASVCDGRGNQRPVPEDRRRKDRAERRNRCRSRRTRMRIVPARVLRAKRRFPTVRRPIARILHFPRSISWPAATIAGALKRMATTSEPSGRYPRTVFVSSAEPLEPNRICGQEGEKSSSLAHGTALRNTKLVQRSG